MVTGRDSVFRKTATSRDGYQIWSAARKKAGSFS